MQLRNFFKKRKLVGIQNLFPRVQSRKAGSCRWEISPPLSWCIIGWILNTKLSLVPYLDSNLWLLCLARSMKTSEKYCATFTASLDVIKMNNECHLTGIFSLLSVRNPRIFRSPLKYVFFWMELRSNRADYSQTVFKHNQTRKDCNSFFEVDDYFSFLVENKS